MRTPARGQNVLVAMLIGAAVAAGCASGDRSRERPGGPASPQSRFWGGLESMCGLAFEGRVVEDTSESADFAGKRLVMHVRSCDADRILVPFHVGDDRSRTWVFTREATGLRLKHDHRHRDGSEDDLTQYGGDTRTPGTAGRQEFYADAHTAMLIPAAADNVWTVEIVPGRSFAYGLRREGTARRFRVEFDLTRAVAAPPPPWGHEGG